MRSWKAAWALAMVLAAMTWSSVTIAHHGGHYRTRAHIGVFIGAPAFYYPPPFYYYPAPYYYYPPVVAVPASPPAYIERGNGSSSPEPSQGTWYYCPETRAYYPYVKQCAGGWQRVPAQPQG